MELSVPEYSTKTKKITEYEAAYLIGMSPRLLTWLAGHAPRPESNAKLKIAGKIKETVFFDEAELLNFNAWLSQPWPNHKDGSRATIPAGIREEIRTEANGECAICQKNGDKCEAAHIRPFSQTQNHHPTNLIWLCSNHHTAFDKGLFEVKKEDQKFVKSIKEVLHHFKRSQWGAQHELSIKIFETLNNLERLNTSYTVASTSEHKKAAAKYAMKALSDLNNLAPVSKTDSNYAAYQRISTEIFQLQGASKTTPVENVPKVLKQASRVRRKYSAAMGYSKCPLCKGSGLFRGDDCPACGSLGEMPSKIAGNLDVHQYDLVQCPLCKGRRNFKGNNCPECSGEGKCLRLYADQFDEEQYREVKCPACDGTGRIHGEDCPECDGEGTLESRFADRVDPRGYDLVPCPACKGRRRFKGEDCMVCGAEGEMQRQHAEKVDLTQYEAVECPVCKGSKRLDGDDCPACGGEGSLGRWQEEQLDMSQYEMVECPECEGARYINHEQCLACDGSGEMRRWQSDRLENS